MRRPQQLWLFVCSFVVMGLTMACQPAPPPDTRVADAEAIRASDGALAKAAGEKDIDAFLAAYAEDASVFPPGAPKVTGKAAMREALSPMFASEGFSLSFTTDETEVARSGDLAYSTGTYEVTLNDAEGKPQSEKGKSVVVWKKQADGTWKVQADIWNSDAPPPGTAESK